MIILVFLRYHASYVDVDVDVDVDVKEATNQVPTLQMISALQS